MTPHSHSLSVRIYLEDTDAQGIVYHANYLKYCERARTDILAEQGYRLADLQAQGFVFVVYEMRLKFHRPARLHDQLEIRSTAARTSDYRLTFSQTVFLEGATDPVFTAEAHVVAIDDRGNLRALPEGLLTT
ncbi:MAG: YbgC/FadM family acyl-CoA thioesterase [Deltaproteobacteria bacterium]|nr:YbgC/FadM family acyl-CoA thioesterase [Deltaproteobacteria bacterium]